MNDGSPYAGGTIVTYDRARMLLIRGNAFSTTRPDNLSIEFNDEDGKFSPAKWLEHHWIKEGIVNKPQAPKKKPVEKLKSEAEMDGTVLSPQRKGFSLGCRASSPKTGDDTNTDKKSNWRAGNLKSSSNGIDFKPPFQKANLENQRNAKANNGSSTGNWRSTIADRDNMYKSGTNRSKYGNDKGDEKLPEWLDDGPSSMSDVIELKGFDDEGRTARERRTKLRAKERREGKDPKEHAEVAPVKATKETKEVNGANVAATVATENVDPSNPLEALLSGAPQKKTSGGSLNYASMANTVSDLEFAALLGIIDDTTQPKKVDAPSAQTTGSRLSRFFAKNVEKSEPAAAQQQSGAEPGRRSSVDMVQTLLAPQVPPMGSGMSSAVDKLMKMGGGDPQRPPMANTKVVPGVINLEDLEKSFTKTRPTGVEEHAEPRRHEREVNYRHPPHIPDGLPGSSQAPQAPPMARENFSAVDLMRMGGSNSGQPR
ncbi:hypothetical protein L596_023589 [Steinernema carpocapsae]|uniref:Uncharacterized protein n=1 Tax=Steinernema carpocapsae TaxID=34508 RepID=A0A4U5ME29_STECR|nr:hypothetical protein L596_023589 [Steinernema carpocapsae]